MRIVVVTPPAPVVTWEEAEQHLRLDGDVEQKPLVERLIAAATAHIDGPQGWLGRALGLQTLETFLPAFGVTSICLPYPPAVDIVSIGYVDGDGATVAMEAADYELRGPMLRPAWPKSWPSAQWRGSDGETVRIRYRAGYAVDPAAEVVTPNVPEPIKAAILLMVGDLWHARATVATGAAMAMVPMSATVESLLQPFRVYR
jgi:uncharacterized phiE125 gp8 family phage protein